MLPQCGVARKYSCCECHGSPLELWRILLDYKECRFRSKRNQAIQKISQAIEGFRIRPQMRLLADSAEKNTSFLGMCSGRSMTFWRRMTIWNTSKQHTRVCIISNVWLCPTKEATNQLLTVVFPMSTATRAFIEIPTSSTHHWRNTQPSLLNDGIIHNRTKCIFLAHSFHFFKECRLFAFMDFMHGFSVWCQHVPPHVAYVLYFLFFFIPK